METKITYFENGGESNTDAALAAARQRAKELDIKKIVVASTRGNTAVKAVNAFENMNVVIVTHSIGLHDPNVNEFLDDNRKIVEIKGGKLLTATHGFGGINVAFQKLRRPPSPGTIPGPLPGVMPLRLPVPGNIIAQTFFCFSRGMKVAAEIVIMAADAGLVRTDEEVIAIAGSGRGADTAIVVKPTNTHRFFELQIKEIICKPR